VVPGVPAKLDFLKAVKLFEAADQIPQRGHRRGLGQLDPGVAPLDVFVADDVARRGGPDHRDVETLKGLDLRVEPLVSLVLT